MQISVTIANCRFIYSKHKLGNFSSIIILSLSKFKFTDDSSAACSLFHFQPRMKRNIPHFGEAIWVLCLQCLKDEVKYLSERIYFLTFITDATTRSL